MNQRSIDFNTFEHSLLKDPKYKREVEKIDLAFEISQMIKEARLVKGYSQQKLAELMGTKQTGISRAENGNSLPSLTFLEKIAKALQSYLLPPRFSFMYFDGLKKTTLNTNASSNTNKILSFSGISWSSYSSSETKALVGVERDSLC